MDPRIQSILYRLPQEATTALEQSRGNGNAVWSLLELYRENGYITPDEETLLYNEYIIATANHSTRFSAPQQSYGNQYNQQNYSNQYNRQGYGSQNPQAGYGNAQPDFNIQLDDNPQYGNQYGAQYNAQYNQLNPEIEKQTAYFYSQYKKGKRNFTVGIILAVICLFYTFVMGFSFSKESETPSNLIDNLSEITSGKDYFIKDAKLLGSYAEYFQVPEGVTEDENDEIPEDRKTVTDDFYLAYITDSNENEYLTSISFKHSSDIATKLRNHDFENGVYDISAYFEAKTLSSFVSDSSQESISDIFNETIDMFSAEIGFYVETIDWNFEYSQPEDYDYEASKSTGIMLSVFFLIPTVGMVILAVSGKKKQKKYEAEIAALGYKV